MKSPNMDVTGFHKSEHRKNRTEVNFGQVTDEHFPKLITGIKLHIKELKAQQKLRKLQLCTELHC